MSIFGRLICYSAFAAVGVGVAVYIGSLALAPENAAMDNAPSAQKNVEKSTAEKTSAETSTLASSATSLQNVDAVAHVANRPVVAQPAGLGGDADSVVGETAIKLQLPASLPASLPVSLPVSVAMEPKPSYAENMASSTPARIEGEQLSKIEVSSKQKASLHAVPKWSESHSPAVPASTSSSATAASKASPAVQSEGGGKLRIHIYNEDLREVLGLLGEQANLNILVGRNVEGKISATLSGVDAMAAIDAILKSTGYVCRRDGKFLFVGRPCDFEAANEVRDLIAVKMYRTNYVRAAELATLIKPLLSLDGAASVSTPSERVLPASDCNVGGEQFAGNEVIVVRDRESVLAMVEKVMAKVDIPPMQVAIDAMILRVQLGENDPCGVDFGRICRCNATQDGAAASSAAAGLKIGFLDADPRVLLETLQRDDRVTVVANPRLMVLNKQRAEIHIGRRDGYVGRAATEATASQNMAFLDTGALLRIRPFISADGQIRMEIQPEVSDGGVNVQGGFALPSEDITQATTNIMARDGRTVLIGGLIRKQAFSVTTNAPVVGELPLLGGLFRRTSEHTTRYETLVLITPHIVRETAAVNMPAELK